MSSDMLRELDYLEKIILDLDNQIRHYIEKYDDHYVYIMYTVFRRDCGKCPHNLNGANCQCFEVVNNLINLLNEKIDERMGYYDRYQEIRSVLIYLPYQTV